MNNIIGAILKDNAMNWLFVLLTTLIPSVFLFLSFFFRLIFPNLNIDSLEKITLLRTILFLSAILSGLFAYVLKLNKKPNLKDYNLIDPPSYYAHKRKGGKYCQPCLIKHIKVELTGSESLYCCICEREI